MIKGRIGSDSDIEGVLSLQEKYLFRNMSEQERNRGFVTTPFTKSQIQEIIKQNGFFVASNKNEIIAYAFAADWEYFEQWEIFNYMVSRFPQISFHGSEITTENTFQYGPICIDIPFRGKGVMNLLIEIMRIEFLKRFPISITFINQINEVSVHAHKKIGWEIVDTFEFNDNKYLALGLDMNKSLLKIP